MKAGVAKFVSCYNTIKDLDESGKTVEDITKGALELYKKKVEFKPCFSKHCWLLLWTYRSYPGDVAAFKSMGAKGRVHRLLQIVCPWIEVKGRECAPQQGMSVIPQEARSLGFKSSKQDYCEVKENELALKAI